MFMHATGSPPLLYIFAPCVQFFCL